MSIKTDGSGIDFRVARTLLLGREPEQFLLVWYCGLALEECCFNEVLLLDKRVVSYGVEIFSFYGDGGLYDLPVGAGRGLRCY